MAFAAPLAIPAAEALWAGAVIAGGAILTAIGIREVSRAADRDFADAPPSSVQNCPGRGCDPECPRIQAAINRALATVKQRYAEMRADRHGLFAIRPASRPNLGSWPGHVQQYRGWQANLRTNLNQAAIHGCPIPSDAWQWASRPPPTQPAP